jgi:tetratricopeptide repeat protein 21B
MSNNKNAGVGFRLAFNYLKAERYTDTIDVGRQVLAAFPDFPQVKIDLMTKARANLR